MDKFKYIDRGYGRDMVLLPGWATDHRIFDTMDIPYDYILVREFDPYTFTKDMLDHFAARGFSRVSLFGWSMGGFAAAEFAGRHPGLVEELVLVSVREKYPEHGIAAVKKMLEESRRAYLYKFYQECFSDEEKELLAGFKDGLMRSYFKDIETEELMKGLEYLASATLDLDGIKKASAKLIFGKKDKIVPVTDIVDMKKNLKEAEIIFAEGAGHMPFLRKDFGNFFRGPRV